MQNIKPKIKNVDNVKLLDCTLRDGGYVNDWKFTNEEQRIIVDAVKRSKIEIVEHGYLSDTGYTDEGTLFHHVDSIDPNFMIDTNTLHLAMINFGSFDVKNLPEWNETYISAIRLAFHKKDRMKIAAAAEEIIKKGYKAFIQPMNTILYTEEELLELIESLKDLDIFALYMVDSFGTMKTHDIERLFKFLDDNLKKGVQMGFHGHNNRQLAYSNAIRVVELAESTERTVMVDASIYGMGRAAGNVNTELMIEYFNKNTNKHYEIDPILEVIENNLIDIYEKAPWGYTIPNFLIALCNAHPNYVAYFVNKNTLNYRELEEALYTIDAAQRVSYNKDIAEAAYTAYCQSKNK